MKSVKPISLDEDIIYWLNKNIGRGDVSSFVNKLLKKEMEKEKAISIGACYDELESIWKAKDELDKKEQILTDKISELRFKEKSLAEQKEQDEKKKIVEEQKIRLQKEIEVITIVSSLIGIEEIKEDFVKNSESIKPQWYLDAVDRLRQLNPSIKIGVFQLRTYLNKEIINKK